MKRQSIQLSDHFDYRRLLRFSLSPILTMVFTSLYGIVDGFFVSNYAGTTPFAALNLVFPYIMMIASVGFMFGAGGSALVAFHLGTGEKEKANRYFSMITYTMSALAILLSAISVFLAPDLSRWMGSSEEMLPYCVTYLRINMFGMVFFMLQQLFQSFLITAEKPKLAFKVTLIAGCTNMFLDWLLVGILDLGITGAALATISSQAVGGLIPLIWFFRSKDGLLHLEKTNFELPVIIKVCGNGISEFLSDISSSFVGMLYNLQLLRFAGENGVSAYGIIMYIAFIFAAIDIGYNIGVSPVISYHDGAGNPRELKSLFQKSLCLITVMDIAMTVLAFLTARPLARLFVGYEPILCEMTVKGMKIYSLAFLFGGYNYFASAFFTALNNGKVSAILSVSRTLALQIIMIYLLPALFGENGLWMVAVAVELIGIFMTVFYLKKYGKQYGYR